MGEENRRKEGGFESGEKEGPLPEEKPFALTGLVVKNQN
jgi:hypothetical protein